MRKASVFLAIAEAVSGVLSVIALVGNLIIDSKEAKDVKQIGCDTNGKK